MAVQTFYLFRITLHEKSQPNMFAEELSKSAFLLKLVYHLQASTNQQMHYWHIGNVEKLNTESLYFRFGRVTKKQISELDRKGDFIDTDIDLARYSHCILDSELQLLTMSFNSNLSPSISSLGSWLQKLLNVGLTEYPNYETVEVRIIPDYEEFLSKIKESYSVNRFWIKVKKPNLFDLDKDFIKPISRLNQEMQSDEIKIEMSGNDLDRTNIETLTESTTLAGSQGGAYIQSKKNQKKQYILLGKNNLSFEGHLDENKNSKIKLLKMIRKMYDGIREKFNRK